MSLDNSSDPTHSIDLNTTELDVIRNILPQLRINDDIEHFRLEIESGSPITIDEDEQTASEQLDDEPANAIDQDEPDLDDDQPDLEDPDQDDLDDEPADAIDQDEPTQKSTKATETGDPAQAYLDAVDAAQGADAVDATEYLETNLNPDTQKWYVTGLLYRAQGGLTTSQMTSMLEGTSWEMQTNSISATLTPLQEAGIVEKIEKEDERWPLYQLTQLGRDAMYRRVCETPGYGLKPADKANNLDPNSTTVDQDKSSNRVKA